MQAPAEDVRVHDDCLAQVAAPLHWLARLGMVRVVDLRGVHNDGAAYWPEAKCRTMRHIADLARALKRRNKHARVHFSPS